VSSILNLGANATLVMTLGDIQRCSSAARWTSRHRPRALGQSAKITTESFPTRCSRARHADLADRVEGQRHDVRGEGVDRQRRQGLKANMTANAEIVPQEFADSLLVPEAAVVFDAKRKPFVDLVDPGSKTGRRRVPVTVGVGNGTKMQIRDGVKAGDKVVLPG
jgi:HlyD family secretion protein